MKNDYCLLGDAARALKCKPYRITYLLGVGRIPEPRRIGGRRVFTARDLVRIAGVLKLELQDKRRTP